MAFSRCAVFDTPLEYLQIMSCHPYLHYRRLKLTCPQLAGKLFGVSVEAADGQAPIWHPDVRFFKVFLDGKLKAYLYLDPYSRPAGTLLPHLYHATYDACLTQSS